MGLAPEAGSNSSDLSILPTLVLVWVVLCKACQLGDVLQLAVQPTEKALCCIALCVSQLGEGEGAYSEISVGTESYLGVVN